MKPSEDIRNKLQALIAESPEIQEGLKAGDVSEGMVLSAVMIQAILNWLDEKFPS